MFKIGDKVLNKYNGKIGVVAHTNLPGIPDCVVVRFDPASDGLTIPKTQLEKVTMIND
jgi:hypothetical protein